VAELDRAAPWLQGIGVLPWVPLAFLEESLKLVLGYPKPSSVCSNGNMPKFSSFDEGVCVRKGTLQLLGNLTDRVERHFFFLWIFSTGASVLFEMQGMQRVPVNLLGMTTERACSVFSQEKQASVLLPFTITFI
jgi:hypothetical protein